MLSLFTQLLADHAPPAAVSAENEPVLAGPATRERLLEEIVRVNRSATRDFLARFDDAALRGYLDHLGYAVKPRNRDARWVRPGDTRAICVAEPA